MLKNNILIALRLLIKHRTYSFINIIGLSLGLASFLVILLFYQYQISYDQHLSKKDRLYRINREMRDHDQAGYISKISANAAKALDGNITGVESTLRISDVELELSQEDKAFRDFFIWAADETVFNLFDFELISGNGTTALSQINSIVLTESMALKYFGSTDILSKTLQTLDLNGQPVDLKVTGVIRDVPATFHVIVNALISHPTMQHFKGKDYASRWTSCHTYLLLNEGTAVSDVERVVADILADFIPAEGFEQADFPLMPVTDIFFNPGKDGGAQRGSLLLTNILLLIGVFILLIASLNYVNLATARSLKRSREVGIRKVSGANKGQLILQFMGESIVICLVALSLALLIVYSVLPYVNSFSNIMYTIDLTTSDLLSLKFLGLAFSVAVGTGIISGLYPAFVISSFRPTKSLKGELVSRSNVSSKKILVVAQYVVSVFLLVSCIGIYKIFNHLKNQDFGFNKENVIAVNVDNVKDPAKVQMLKNELSTSDGVMNVASCSKIPLSHRNENSVLIYHEEQKFKYGVPLISVDHDYFKLLDIQVQEKVDTELDGVYVSQLFFEKYKDQYAIGSGVDMYSPEDQKKVLRTASIIGVVNDIKERVLSPRKGPVIFDFNESNFNYLLVKLAPEKQHETIASIEGIFKSHHPFLAFSFKFADDEMNMMFNMISPFSKLIYYATFFAIIIASMGLFALALFVTQQRTKEVGIRKIFGSGEWQVSFLLAKQYIKLILFSFLISGPLTFTGFKWMFSLFPQKLEMSWWLLFAVGAGLLLLAVLTVCGQSWKVAKSNPVNTLRYE